MATKTFNVTKQYMCSTNGNANPGDLHIPIGLWAPGTGLNWVGRTLLYAPISFSGMTAINSARLYLSAHTAAGYHAKGSGNSTIRIYRKTASWSETSGGASSSVDEIWSTGSSSLVTSDITFIEDDVVDSDGTNSVFQYIDITDTVRDWFNGSANHGVMLKANNEDTASGAFEAYSRHSSDIPYMWISYDTNTPPNAPTNLNPTGSEVVNTGTSIVVSGTRSDPDSGDSISGVDIHVWTDDLATLVDDDTYYPSGSPTTFSRTVTVPVANAFYKWAARTRDENNEWGPWSANQRFKANTPPDAPTIALQESPTTDIKTLTPTFVITRNDDDAGDNMIGYRIIVEKSDGTAVWDSGDLVIASTSSTTKLYNGPALTWNTSYRWRARTQDSNSAWGAYSSNSTFTTHLTGVPINLDPSLGEIVNGITPTFTADRNNTSDTIASYQIQVYEPDGVTLKWDSGTLTSGITSGSKFSKAYNGAALSYSTSYTWRARVTGSIGGTSDWSASQSFVTPSANTVTQTAPVGSPITTLTPTFTGTWNDNLNGYQIILYASDGVTQVWDSTLLSQTSATSFSKLYNGPALAWNTAYRWKVRVRRTSDNITQSYTGLAAFTTDTAGTAVLTLPAETSWQTTITPTFTGSSSGGETISTFRIKIYSSDQTTLIWDSGDLAGSGTTFSKVYNGATALLKGATYYWQARYIKSTGPTGNYSALRSFHINADPLAPTNLLPVTGAVALTLTPTFTATFQDADIANWADYPTVYEIEVRNNATDALIASQTLSTGLNSGANSMVWDGTPALAYETTYKWRARFTDSKGSVGAWSSYNTLKPSQPSSVTITGPAATITSPSVTVTWTFSSPSGKAQGSYRVRIIRNSDSIQVYDSGIILSNALSHTVPAGYLQNGLSYNIQVDVYDVDGI